MQDDREAILELVKRLSTNQSLPAWEELVSLCRSECAMNQLRLILATPSVQESTRLVAASVAGRLLVKHAKEYSEGYGEKYLLAVMTDLSLPFQIKKMTADCLTHHARYSPRFLQRLMLISEDMVTSIQSGQHKIKPPALLAMEKDELEQLIATFTQLLRFDFAKEQNWLSACETIILIGQAIVRLIFVDSQEVQKKQENRKATKQQADFSAAVLRLMKCLKVLHKLIVNELNIQKYPELLQKLFKLYQHLTEDETEVVPARKCLMEMMDWYFLPASIFEICKLDLISSDKDKMIDEKTLNLRSKASYFFSMFIREIKETQGRAQIKNMLEMFIEPSKQAISTFNTAKNDPFYENLMHLVCLHHLERTDIPVKEMIADFQHLISPFITRLLTKDRFQLFVNSPEQLYAKLSEIVQGNSHYGTLDILSHLLIHFTTSSLDFFIYLFQAFRLSLEKRLHCDYCQNWNIPDYLENSKPLEIITVFYIMAIIPYNNKLASGLFEYLRLLITPQFVDQLDYLEISLFYFFLESNWLQIYENHQEGLFLLAHIFKKGINPSAKYFLYEFVYSLSDYFVDERYILAYVQHLPLLHPHENKWDNVFKWITYLLDFEESFPERLVMIINGHIRNEVELSLENKLEAHQHHKQLRNYIKILTHVAKMEKIVKENYKLQVLLLEEYCHIQKILDLNVEDSLHKLLACLCRFFKHHHEFYCRILPDLIERHAMHWSRPSNHFYLILAEYIYHTEDSVSIKLIYRHIDDISSSLDVISEKNERRRYGLLLSLANILIIFQNLLLRHINILGEDTIYNIAAKTLSFEQLLSTNLQKTHTRQVSIILARCLNIQLAIFAVLKCTEIAYSKYIGQIQSGIHQYYDTQFLVAALERLNTSSSKQKRSTILFIISLIMIKESDRQEEQHILESAFYQLPNKMTPVFTKAASVFRQIKKFMAFYRIPDWNRMNELTTGFPPQFFIRFKQFFDLMMSKDVKQLKKRQKENMTVMDEGEPVYAKKRRAAVHLGDEDEEQGRVTVRRHETFTKRVKIDSEMLPKKSSRKSQSEEEEEIVDFVSKDQTELDNCDHSKNKALKLLTFSLASQPNTSNEQNEQPEHQQQS